MEGDGKRRNVNIVAQKMGKGGREMRIRSWYNELALVLAVVVVAMIIMLVLGIILSWALNQFINGQDRLTTQTVATPTEIATATLVQPTLVPATPTPDLWQLWVDDVLRLNPSASIDAATLQGIARFFPEDLPFINRDPGSGLVPYAGETLNEVGARGNSPEGGYAYLSWGHGCVTVVADGRQLCLPWQEHNVYLTLVVGYPDDRTAVDHNRTLQFSEFAEGHVYYSLAAPQMGQVFQDRAVVNQPWLAQQIWWASQSGTNCGVGCEARITVVLWDLYAGVKLFYAVNPSNYEWISIDAP